MKYYLKLLALWAVLTAGAAAGIVLLYGVIGLIVFVWNYLLPTSIAGIAAGLTTIGMAVAVFVILMREELVSRN